MTVDGRDRPGRDRLARTGSGTSPEKVHISYSQAMHDLSQAAPTRKWSIKIGDR
jgi:hypothetical protein